MNRIVRGALIGVGGLVGLAVLTVGGVLSYIALTPRPEVVCEGLSAIIEKEPKLAAMNPEMRRLGLQGWARSCAQAMARPQYGSLKWSHSLRCLDGAQTKEDVVACDGARADALFR